MPVTTVLADERVRNAVAGGIAGLVSATVTVPLDMVKLQLQNDGIRRKSAIKTFQNIYDSHGIRGLYRGVYATAAGYLPTWAIYFTVYDASKKYYLEARAEEKNSIMSRDSTIHSISAIQGGLFCTILTNPFWVVRTRIMTQPETATANSPYYYKSVRSAFWEIYTKEGWKAFFKGLGPSLLGVSHVAIQFPLYERFKQFGQENAEFNSAAIIMASGISKIIASAISYPHEVVRTRLQTQSAITLKPTYTGILQTVKLVYQMQGIRGFYRGYLLSLIRTVPASALTIWTFEFISNILEKQYGKQNKD